jgi:phosphoribosylformylglycinamidine synthase
VMQRSLADGHVVAYHDRSDGGLFAALAEMAFAGHCGLDVDIASLGGDPLAVLFNEELGAVLQVRSDDVPVVLERCAAAGLGAMTHRIGAAVPGGTLRVKAGGHEIYTASRVDLHRAWAELSFAMQSRRDNPDCAREEYDTLLDDADPGLSASLTYPTIEDQAAPFIATGVRPRIAILREQGVNGQYEMAAAFDRAGFATFDVHMSDILGRRRAWRR